MSGTSNHYGPIVNMNGGRNNVGINHGTVGGAAPDPALCAAVVELSRLLRELRPHLAPEEAGTVDGVLPALVQDPEGLRGRGAVLESVARIAGAVGDVGRPALEAVARLTALLGLSAP